MAHKILVEKRVAIFSADTLAELGRLGVKFLDGSGRIHAVLEVPEGAEKDVRRVVRAEDFAIAPGETDPGASNPASSELQND